jgi:hypothetical protein
MELCLIVPYKAMKNTAELPRRSCFSTASAVARAVA